MCIYNTFQHLSLQIYELYKEYANKKAKKLKRNKMEQSRFAGLCYFCIRIKKNQLTMIQLSKKLLTFVPSVETDWRHRGELLSFDPSENLENSTYAGEKSESCFSCSSIYTAHSAMESAHIYTCRCELISFLRIQVFQNLLAKGCEKAHTLCI